ncbi:MAG TPA: COX15/CtaA family protein [Solirubrobacterales bacterium]|jgi:heme A synthase|nr:COX15/CtaA family protein [Solirubrobacterales bacterium]
MAGSTAGDSGGDALRRFRRLADLTIVATFGLILLGGIVRVSESGLGCGPGGSGTEGWPLCNGSAVPFFHDTEVIIEFSHRVLAAVVTALIALLVWTAYRHLRERRWPLRASLWAAGLVLVQAALGGLTVEHSLDEELVAAHLGLAMILIGLMLWIAVRARGELAAREEDGPDRAAAVTSSPVRGLKPFAAAAAVLLLCAIVAGGYVAGTEEEGVHGAGRNVNGAHLACGDQFPGCLNQGALPFGESRLSDIHLTHRAFVYAATIAILALLGVAFARGSRSRLLALAAALLACQLLLGALNVWLGEHATLIVAHLVTATLLWSTVLLIAYRLAWSPQPAGAAGAARAAPAGASTAAA